MVNNNDSAMEPRKPGKDKKTPPPKMPQTIPILCLMSLVVVAITAITFPCKDCSIEFELGYKGGKVMIDKRNPPSYPPITDNSSNTK